MNKETIIEQMQLYLAGRSTEPDFEPTAEMSDLQSFYCRTAKRLKIAYVLRRGNPCYQEDFLMALRDFLLIFETSMTIESIEITADNPYAIKKNTSTGKYFANFQLPDGVPTELAEQAFMRNLPSEDQRRKEYNLITDSLIYAVTGLRKF